MLVDWSSYCDLQPSPIGLLVLRGISSVNLFFESLYDRLGLLIAIALGGETAPSHNFTQCIFVLE